MGYCDEQRPSTLRLVCWHETLHSPDVSHSPRLKLSRGNEMIFEEINVARLWAVDSDMRMNVALEPMFSPTRPTVCPSGSGLKWSRASELGVGGYLSFRERSVKRTREPYGVVVPVFGL